LSLVLSSSAFPPRGEIPTRHTCEGPDLSPPLSWSGLPAGTRSLALIVDDPDAPDPRAPRVTWVHWVVYNLPAAVSEISEGLRPQSLPAGARCGLNDWQKPAWGGPCPPVGRHRYFFKLHALDVVLPDLGAATKAELEQAMGSHVLARAELVGTYEKKRR
jgi:Raf kinase inhibitor-like YbhB/YbcL family protein